ncbi:DUF2206 domain-containing protein, partial [Dehalococcoidia bacterium]|nr:DUF2206 domain-containing protein [Dehalococcoidia bacterium]
PLQANDWKIGKFLRLVIAIQLATLGAIGLGVLGFDIPFLRQVVCFIFLTFVPGLLLLRILKLHRLGTINTLLYSVGLSIAFVMFLGFFINMLYPLIGISEPISTLPLIITLTVAVAILSVIAYIRESREAMAYPRQHHHSVPWSDIFTPAALLLLLLPLLSAIGAYYLANFHQNNILLLILIGLIALIAGLIAFDTFIPQRLYPFAVVMIAISLLWHWSLISQHLTGWDIQVEYYYQNLTLANSLWDPTLPTKLTTTLSVTMLAPIYSLMLNMDSVWVFKIVYPLYFSLVPLALFQVFRKQTDDKIAFCAVFFFMSFSIFFTEMLALARQQIAGLFFALSILLLLDRGMAATKRAALLIILGFSIIVSHYGLSYFYMLYLLLALFLLFLSRTRRLGNLWSGLPARFGKPSGGVRIPAGPLNPVQAIGSTSTLSTTYVCLVVVFGLAWYMHTASGLAFDTIVYIGNHLYHSLGELAIGATRDTRVLIAIGLASPEVSSVQRELFRILQWLTQLFIVVGVTGLAFNLRKTRFQPVFIAMTFVSTLLLLMAIVLPYFTAFHGMGRIYHITLFFLAPFCVLGGVTTFRWLLRRVRTKPFHASNNPGHVKLVVMLVLTPYLLFGTGFIFEVTGDVPTSIALNAEMNFPRFNEQELASKEWLRSNMDTRSRVYADLFGRLLLYGHLWGQVGTFWGETREIPDHAYIYLRGLNVKQGEVMQSLEEHRNHIQLQSSPFGEEVLAHRNRIYDNGGACVYY